MNHAFSAKILTLVNLGRCPTVILRIFFAILAPEVRQHIAGGFSHRFDHKRTKVLKGRYTVRPLKTGIMSSLRDFGVGASVPVAEATGYMLSPLRGCVEQE